MIVKSALPLSFIIGSRFFGLFIILPVISVYALELEGATEFLIGVLIGVYAISQITFQVVFGYVSDRFGRKSSMLIGLLVFIAGAVICAAATDIYAMILGRFIQGAGAIGAVAIALMSDMTKEEVRGHAMAMMGAFIGISFTLSMILSPILSAKYGLSSLFYLSIAVTVVCIVLLYTAVGEEPKFTHSQAKMPAVKLLSNRNLLLMNISNFMQKMLMSAAFIVIPIAIVKYFGMDKKDLSGIYSVATVFGFIAMGIGGGTLLKFYGLSALSAVVTALCVVWLIALKWLDNPNIFKNIYLPSSTDADLAEIEKQKGVVECYKNAQNLVVKYNSKLTNEAEIKQILGV